MVEQEKNDGSFSAYILLSKAIQFNSNEIEQALLEAYPALDLQTETSISFAQDCDTDQFVTTPILFGAKGRDSAIAMLTRKPGSGQWDPQGLTLSQQLQFPEIKKALEQNASYICVTTEKNDQEETSEFRVARLCSCLAAIFAKLPAALAVYWETANHFLTPTDVVKMADKAMSDEFPIEKWIGVNLNRLKDENKEYSSGITRGLKQFKGCEISLAAAPLDLATAANTLTTAAAMLTSYGQSFRDGGTVSHEGQSPEQSMRIRFAPSGTNGSSCDAWVLVHPDSPFDHEDALGEMQSAPSPQRPDQQVKSKIGFFKRLIRGGRHL